MGGDQIKCFMVERRNGAFWREDVVLCDTIWLLPPGAMWLRDHAALDGKEDPSPRPMPHLAVMTPSGLWCIDCPATDTPSYWSRRGEPPNVTAEPSILVGHGEYHGWLRDGILVAC